MWLAKNKMLRRNFVETVTERIEDSVRTASALSCFTESDSMKYDNDDISIDEAVANNNGHFFVCNANILNAAW